MFLNSHKERRKIDAKNTLNHFIATFRPQLTMPNVFKTLLFLRLLSAKPATAKGGWPFGFCPVPGFLTGWKTTLLRGGMQYNAGKLIVPNSGVYYVYSQIYYYVSVENSTLIHITSVNDNPIAKSVRSSMLLYNTVFHGRLVFLNADDTITIRLGDDSSPRLLVRHASFFGAFLI